MATSSTPRFVSALILGAVASAATMLGGCGPSEQAIRDSGFRSAAEMRQAEQAGHSTGASYAQYLGYANLAEMQEAPENLRAETWAASRGFADVEQMRRLSAEGHASFDDYAKHLGFESGAELRDATAAGFDDATAYRDHLRELNDPLRGYPEDEKRFVRIMTDSLHEAAMSDNELRDTLILASREKALCELMRPRKFAIRDWIGTLEGLSTGVMYGEGIVKIAIANGVILRNYESSNDWLAPHIAIPTDSEIFKNLASLSEGQRVVFSGSLFAAESHNSDECLHQRELQAGIRLESPELTLRLDRIAAAE